MTARSALAAATRPRERVVLSRIREGHLHHLRRSGGLARPPASPRLVPSAKVAGRAAMPCSCVRPQGLCWPPPSPELARCPAQKRSRAGFGSRSQPETAFPSCAASSCARAQASIAARWAFSQSRSGNIREAPQSAQVTLRSGMGPSILARQARRPGFAGSRFRYTPMRANAPRPERTPATSGRRAQSGTRGRLHAEPASSVPDGIMQP